jgi:hypothetical protein
MEVSYSVMVPAAVPVATCIAAIDTKAADCDNWYRLRAGVGSRYQHCRSCLLPCLAGDLLADACCCIASESAMMLLAAKVIGKVPIRLGQPMVRCTTCVVANEGCNEV